MDTETKTRYINVVRYIYGLIRDEMMQSKTDPNQKENLPVAYPKLVIMYEFFRMLRGEAFLGNLPLRPMVGEYQKEFYEAPRLKPWYLLAQLHSKSCSAEYALRAKKAFIHD